MNKDKEILRLLERRDESAISILLDDYGGLIKSIVGYHLRCLPSEDVEECIDDIIWDVWRQYDSYDSRKGSFECWIAAISKYKALGKLRKCRKLTENENIEDFELASSIDVEAEVLEEELNDELEKILSVLKKDEKELVLDYYLHDKTIKELASEKKTREQTIYKRIERAIKKIQRRRKRDV